MNSPDPRIDSRPAAVTAALPSRPLTQDESHERYRERDFGIGYGRSSGYAQSRSYVPGLRNSPFSVR